MRKNFSAECYTAQKNFMERMLKAVKTIKEKGLYPGVPLISTPHQNEILANGEKMLLFSSNSYLGMTIDERVKKAAIKGIEKWGIGTGNSRVLTGNLEIHSELENLIAEFKGREAAITFVTGYMVNEGCIPAISNVLEVSAFNKLFSSFKMLGEAKADTIIFSDQYNHASTICGISLSKVEKEIFRHNDMDDLREKLKQYPKKRRKLIITEGVFSMDGDILKLPEVVSLAKEYNAMLYVDDAHSTGILGKNGRGTEDYFNMEGAVDFMMGTFTKAFGGVGGFMSGSKDIIDYFRITAKSYIFTAPIAPPIVYGLMESIKILKEENWRRDNLLKNAEYLRQGFKDLGFNTLTSQTQIIPVLIGDENKAKEASRYLWEHGILVPAVTWPAVSKGNARLRFTPMYSHTKEQIDYVLEVMKGLKNKLKF